MSNLGGQPDSSVPLLALKQQRPHFLTVVEAAGLMRVSTDLIYDLIREGAFPTIKLRNRYVVPLRALQQLETDAMSSGSVIDVTEWTGTWLDHQRRASAAWVG